MPLRIVYLWWAIHQTNGFQQIPFKDASPRIGPRYFTTSQPHIHPSYGNGKPFTLPISFVRRDVSLVNIAKETENENDTAKRSDAATSFDQEEFIDDDDDDTEENDVEPMVRNMEPICRVVATSDAQIPSSAYSSLSESSKTIVKQLELLYSAKSQKKLRDITYASSIGGDHSAQTTNQDDLQDQEMICTLKQSLKDGGFKLMNQRDFDLCSALNAGYLLRLSLLPDLKDLDPTIGQQFYPELYGEVDDKSKKTSDKLSLNNKLLFDGRVLVFRRGYSQEITTGRLLLPKLDYLQASLVQRSSASLTRKLGLIEQKLEKFIASIFDYFFIIATRWRLRLLMMIQGITLGVLKSSGLIESKRVTDIISKNDFFEVDYADLIEQSEISVRVETEPELATTKSNTQIRGNKLFRLGRYRVAEKYSTFTTIANSLDLSDVLSPFLLCEVGNNDTSSIEIDMYEGLDTGKLTCQYDEIYYQQHNYTADPPAMVRLLERVSIQNTVDFFSEMGRRDLIKNYFKKSTLMEPSYEEVIVIWRPRKRTASLKKQLSQYTTLPGWIYNTARIFDMEDKLPKREDDKSKNESKTHAPALEIRAFTDVPMANIPAVLPKTKLIFRPADAFVFDVVSIASFLSLGASLKFDNPRLDLLAVISLSVFAIRTFFRYSNKYARYDLLVNKFLTKKLTHRGTGALNYIVSQANSQKALRSGLVRDWLIENKICLSVNEGNTAGVEQNNSVEDDALEVDAEELDTDQRTPTRLQNLDYDILQLGKSFANNRASTNEARVDVDIVAAVEELDSLGLLDVVEDGKSLRFQVKDEQPTNITIQQLWNDILTL